MEKQRHKTLLSATFGFIFNMILIAILKVKNRKQINKKTVKKKKNMSFCFGGKQHVNMSRIRIKCRGGVNANHKIMGGEIFPKTRNC